MLLIHLFTCSTTCIICIVNCKILAKKNSKICGWSTSQTWNNFLLTEASAIWLKCTVTFMFSGVRYFHDRKGSKRLKDDAALVIYYIIEVYLFVSSFS